MEHKAARFTILIDADRKKAFDELCAAQDVTSSQMIRQLINRYLGEHGVQDAPIAPPGKKLNRT
jgi:predicted transcriptional regulator